MKNTTKCLYDLDKWGYTLSFNSVKLMFFNIKEEHVHLMSEWCLPYHIKGTQSDEVGSSFSKSFIKDKDKKIKLDKYLMDIIIPILDKHKINKIKLSETIWTRIYHVILSNHQWKYKIKK